MKHIILQAPESGDQDTVHLMQNPSPPSNAPIEQNNRILETEASFIELSRTTANGLLLFENYMRESNYTANSSNNYANGIEELDAIIKRIESQCAFEESSNQALAQPTQSPSPQTIAPEIENHVIVQTTEAPSPQTNVPDNNIQDSVQTTLSLLPPTNAPESENYEIVQPTEVHLPQTNVPESSNQDAVQPTLNFLPPTNAPESSNQNNVQPMQTLSPQTNAPRIENNVIVQPTEALSPQTNVPESNSQDPVQPTLSLLQPINAPESSNQNNVQPMQTPSPQTNVPENGDQDTVQVMQNLLPPSNTPTEQNNRNLETEASFIELSRNTANGLLQFDEYMTESNYTANSSNNYANGMEELDAIIKRIESQCAFEEKKQRLIEDLEQIARTGKVEDTLHFQAGEIKEITEKHLLERIRVLQNELEKEMTEQDSSGLSEFEKERIEFRSTVEFPPNVSNMREAAVFVSKRIWQLGRCSQPQHLYDAYRALTANFKYHLVSDILFLKLHDRADEFRNYEFLTLCGIPKMTL
ncbi:unnamed protein product [Caenorhabditis brenneri]